MALVYAPVEHVTDVHGRWCVEMNKLAFITVSSSTFDTETYWPFATSTGTGLHTHPNLTLLPRISFIGSVVRRSDELFFVLWLLPHYNYIPSGAWFPFHVSESDDHGNC